VILQDQSAVQTRRVQDLWDALLARRGDEAALRELIAAVHVPIVLIGNDHRYRHANPASCLFLRKTAAELRGLRTHDLVTERQHRTVDALWAELLTAGQVAGSIPLRTSDGRQIQIDYRGAANVLPGMHLFAWMPAQWADDELTAGFAEPVRARPGVLSERERDVLAQLAAGATLEQIAERRNLSVSTVRTHLRNAMRRLGARHRTQALAIALRSGELELD
jgi:DNA-binding CsgD family transcriptional regulator